MRYIFLFILFSGTAIGSFSQYYLRGEVRDEQNQPVQGAKIILKSKGEFPFYSGSSGAFGIPSSLKVDTISFFAEGFEPLTSPVETTQYKTFNLKAVNRKTLSSPLTLLSFTTDLVSKKPRYPTVLGESYSSTIENDFVETKHFPKTGYALNVDRACYSNIRRFLNERSRPPTDAVRLEEMLNYFNFDISRQPSPTDGITARTFLTTCPWNTNNQLLFVHLQAKKLNLEMTPPSNFVFLIDVSGSMDLPNRLPLLQSAFKLLVENLRSKDTVSIVTYGGNVSIILQPTSGANKQQIVEAIESLKPSGNTPGESAIRVAYKLARNTFIKNGNNRIILATDGDFNVGQTSEKDLEDLVNEQRNSGIYLTCLGVGMGNYKDSKLETLAKNGNGNFAYLDNEMEAEKVLVEEFAQTLYTVASDVRLTVQFNASVVKEYRLIGFDNKIKAIEDVNSKLQGGELGSGHKLLSVFEIIPTTSEIKDAGIPSEKPDVAQLTLSYKLTENKQDNRQQIRATGTVINLADADSVYRFASAVVMFGSLIKESSYTDNVNWDDVYSLASTGAAANNFLHTEFLELVQKAKKIYGNKKKKR